MNILILNPILYTAQNNIIPKVESVKDCMIYNLGLGFKELGHSVTLVAATEYKPTKEEDYGFEIVFIKSNLKRIFLPSLLPLQLALVPFLYKREGDFDLIVSSETFAFHSLFASLISPKKTIIWHELGLHNNKFYKIPSKIWYNIIPKIFRNGVLIIPRSLRAKEFVSKYFTKVSTDYVEHGLRFHQDNTNPIKKNQLIIVSQLIKRKNIDSIILKFNKYILKYNALDCKLIIVGKGEEETKLKKICEVLDLKNKVIFTGFLTHHELLPILKESKALLIDTKQDLNMVTIAESVVCGTPVLTNTIPYSSEYIAKHQLGISKPIWDEEHINDIINNNQLFINNCLAFRDNLSVNKVANKMITIFNESKNENSSCQ